MNEGWASYWHSTIMTRQGLEPADVVNYADHHSGTMASSPTRLNPYKLGIELLRDIEDRWNHGRFGKDFDECDDMRERRNWDTAAGLGRQKIFEVRRIYNDLMFIDEFLTLDFCRQHKLFSFDYHDDTDTYNIESREFPKIKERLLYSLTNVGRPIIHSPRRQLQKPRRAVPGTPAQRRRPANQLRPRHAGQPPPPLDPSRAYRNRRRRQKNHLLLRRLRTQNRNRQVNSNPNAEGV